MEEDTVRQAKAKALMGEHRWKDAIPLWVDDIVEHPEDPWSVMFLGSCHYELKSYPAALKCFAHAATVDPTLSTPLGLQGDALLSLKKVECARAKYLAALKMEPDSELAQKNWKRFLKISENL